MAYSFSDEDTRRVKAELDQIKAFEKTELTCPLVKREISDAIKRIENALSHEEKQQTGSGGVISRNIDLYYQNEHGMHPLGRMATNTPVSHLKTLLVAKSSMYESADNIQVERTGSVLSLHSSSTLAESDFETGDVVIPGHLKSPVVKSRENPSVRNVRRTDSDGSNMATSGDANDLDERRAFYHLVSSSGHYPRSPFAAVVVSVHYYLLSSTDLVCLTESPNAVPGFAPSVRELPKNVFLPNNWNREKNHVRLLYRSKNKPKYIFKCEMYMDLDIVSVTFGYKDSPKEVRNGGILNSVNVIVNDFICVSSSAFNSATKTYDEFQRIYENENDLFESYGALLANYNFLTEHVNDIAGSRAVNISEEHLPSLANIDRSMPPSSVLFGNDNLVVDNGRPPSGLNRLNTPSPSKSSHASPSSSGQQHFHHRTNSPLSPVSPLHPPPSDWKVDEPDDSSTPWIDASQQRHHSRVSIGDDDLSIHQHSPLDPINPGGGMLMGPGHPVFSDRNDHNYLGGGRHLARHDDIVPPVSTGTGMDPDMFGGDNLSQPPRGTGRKKNKLLPGEPNPDHFKPPSW